jgi:hypothetical protein
MSDNWSETSESSFELSSIFFDLLCTFDTGPTGFEPNYTPVEYFENFLSTEDEDLIDRLVDETNW